jgi:hypothetical protein
MSFPRLPWLVLAFSCALFAAETRSLAQTATGPAATAATPPSPAAAQPAPPRPAPPSYASDPHFVAAMAEGKKLADARQLGFAADDFRKAYKISGGRCIDCFEQAIALEIRSHELKPAIRDSIELLSVATDPRDRSVADRYHAQALYTQAGDKPKPEQLQAVHQLLQDALKEFPGNISARFLDGTVLARLGQTDSARQQFTTCAEQCSASAPYLIRARHFAENPELSYAKMAPAFTVTALDGSKSPLTTWRAGSCSSTSGPPGADPATKSCLT